ncbi:MAG: hypothetical protein N2645_14565 [Clostridia bacterium]|nr:hypothetical protein [Clostridia bacterium]
MKMRGLEPIDNKRLKNGRRDKAYLDYCKKIGLIDHEKTLKGLMGNSLLCHRDGVKLIKLGGRAIQKSAVVVLVK